MHEASHVSFVFDLENGTCCAVDYIFTSNGNVNTLIITLNSAIVQSRQPNMKAIFSSLYSVIEFPLDCGNVERKERQRT